MSSDQKTATGVQHRAYMRRWVLAFENFSADRVEPEGLSARYSRRHPRQHTLPSGRTLIMKGIHRQLWHALLLNAYDLSQSVTDTWVGKERLSQESGLSSEIVGDCLSDLAELGWISRTTRSNASPITKLYLTPMLDKNSPPEPEPVSIANEDMGYYVCQAALRLREDATSKEFGAPLPPGFDQLIEITEFVLSDHKFTQTRGAKKSLTRALLKCVDIAGSTHRCFDVLQHNLAPETEAGHIIFNALLQSDNPAAHIEAAFPTWFALYPHPLPDIEEADISA